MRRLVPSALVLLLTLAAAPRAHAVPFDLIYADQFDVTLCSNGCGITLAGADFGLIVNKNPFDITGTQMYSVVFSVQSSTPDLQLLPFINNPGGTDPTPIHPNEAVGSTTSGYPNNTVLLGKVLPGEVHRNPHSQFIAFEINRIGGYIGPVVFQVTMTMGGDVAHFTMLANAHGGDFNIAFTHAARVSSVPLATAAKPMSWGAVKLLYR